MMQFLANMSLIIMIGLGYKNIEFFGNEVKVALIVRGEDDGQFEEEQYMAYNFLIERWQQLQQSILEPILDYYKQKRYELGYDVESNENYPLIETATQIPEKITLVWNCSFRIMTLSTFLISDLRLTVHGYGKWIRPLSCER